MVLLENGCRDCNDLPVPGTAEPVMPYSYEWQQFYKEEIADIPKRSDDCPNAYYYLLPEANAYVMMGQTTKALCLYEDFIAAARNSKLEAYIPAVERQIDFIYRTIQSQQHMTLHREELLTHLERLERQAQSGAFNAVRKALGLPQVSD
jgi:hypothetical protein